MKFVLVAAFGLLAGAAFSPPPRAQQAPAAAPADAFLTELKQIQKDYGAARQAWIDSLPVNAEGQRHVDEAAQARDPAKEFVAKYQDLARRAKGNASAVQALVLVIQLDAPGGPAGASEDAPSVAALNELLADYIASPDLERLAVNLQYMGWSLGHERAEKALRTLLEKSPHRAVQAAATLSLASALMERAGAKKSADERAAAQGEPKKLFADLQARFGDTPYAKRAEGFVFEMEHLQIGMPAPDYEAVDHDGAKFKLSDYRGKVVVVDFWGAW